MLPPDERLVSLTKPEHCTFLVGLPTTREGFLASKSLDGRGYASKFLGGWNQYEVQLVDNLRRLSIVAKKTGVQYIEAADNAALAAALQNKNRPVVILMSHSSQDALEMAGELIDQEKILNSIPTDFAGIFDIYACKPNALADMVVAERPFCLVRLIQIDVDPTAWLLYFESLFILLQQRRYSYLKASEEITISLINYARTPMKTPKKIADAIGSYLELIKQHSAPSQADEVVTLKPEDKTALLTKFDQINKSNSVSKAMAIAVLVVTFIATLYFAFLYKDDIKSVSIILGGNFLSLLVIAGWLRRIWLEGTTLDILSLLVQGLPPKEAAEVITTFYFGTLNQKV